MSGVLKYFESKKHPNHQSTAPPAESPHSPVLTEADEEFLRRIASDDQGNEESTREVVIAGDGKAAGFEEPEKVPLPASPAPSTGSPPPNDRGIASPMAHGGAQSKTDAAKAKGKEYFSYIQSRVPFTQDFARHQAGGHLHDVAHSVKSGKPLYQPPDPEKEKSDVTNILTRLNLSAINNKAFAFSAESQKLFERFTQILKDIVNGVPTAYNDLEKLLTDSDKQLKEMYDKMPPFMQNLIKSLPSKMTATVAPGLAAVMSEKPGADAQKLGVPTNDRKKSRLKVPALKNLVKGDAVVAMLRSILNFLKLRFPTVLTGTNVLLSLAVFLLLFVFWYCHKRGRETRLEKEQPVAAAGGTGESGESDAEMSDAVSVDESDRAILEAALKHREPSNVPLPHPTSSETDLS